MRCRIAAIVVLSLLFTQWAPAVAAGLRPYVVIDLGNVPDGRSVYPNDLNDAGQVVGTVYTPNPLDPGNSSQNAFRWADGQMTNLGNAGHTNSNAYGINEAGQVTGWVHSYQTDANPEQRHAFVYDSSGMHLFGQDLNLYRSEGRAINDQGQITGWARRNSSENERPIRYDGTNIEYQEAFGQTMEGRAINDLGQVSGYAITPDGNRAFVWNSDGTFATLGVPEGGLSSNGVGINNLGQVTGGWDTSETITTPSGFVIRISRGFITDGDGGQMRDLGSLGGRMVSVRDINDDGYVVGRSDYTEQLGWSHAFVYHDDHGMIDLNDLIHPDAGWELQAATAINSYGQIVGNAWDTRGFLLDPAKNGDADLDGDVDSADLSVLAGNYGAGDAAKWWSGDFNGDDAVDLVDLTLLATNYSGGQAQALADFAMLTSIPEPTTIGVCGIFFCGLLTKRRRGRLS